MTIFYNCRAEKHKRRELHRNMPDAEVILWSKLRGRQLQGYKFRRQYLDGVLTRILQEAVAREGAPRGSYPP